MGKKFTLDNLTGAQKKQIANLHLTVEKIKEIEKTTGWRFYLTADGTTVYFYVYNNTACELYITLRATKNVAVVFYASKRNGRSSKTVAQELCRKKLGENWTPREDVHPSGFRLKNRARETDGQIGTWTFGFGRNFFVDNIRIISGVVDEINTRLKENGIYDELVKLPPASQSSKIDNDTLRNPSSMASAKSYDIVGENGERVDRPRNRIVFGAPGTGKSFKISGEACRHKDDDENYNPGLFESKDGKVCRYERVTFYPTYSYAQFVGTYKPVMRPVEGGEEIAYEFVPGPFLRVLVNALKAPVTNGKKNGWCLIIEEINRANAAAVFGDVFQLLDRGSDGVSEHSVAASEDIKGYLKKELEGQQEALQFLNVGNDGKNDDDWKSCSLRIPDNMYIWATMNSADQGVFPMDTAFKRRWEFEYVTIDNGREKVKSWKIKNSSNAEVCGWNDFREFVNRLLVLCGVNEDKLMGPFFVRATNDFVSAEQFASKVLMYLWEDAARMCRSKLFPNVKTYSELVKLWNGNGPKIFEEVMKDGTPLGKEAKDCWEGLRTKATDETDTSGQSVKEGDAETAQS